MADLQLLDGGTAGAAEAGGAVGSPRRRVGRSRAAVVRHLRPVRALDHTPDVRPCPRPASRVADVLATGGGRSLPAPVRPDAVPRPEGLRPSGPRPVTPARSRGPRSGPRVLVRPVRIPPPHVARRRRQVAAAVAVAALTLLAVLLLGLLADVAAAARDGDASAVTDRSLTVAVPSGGEGPGPVPR